MQTKNLTFQEKRELVQKLRQELNLTIIAEELNISKTLLTYILQGERKDTCGAIDYCFNKIESTVKTIKN